MDGSPHTPVPGGSRNSSFDECSPGSSLISLNKNIDGIISFLESPTKVGASDKDDIPATQPITILKSKCRRVYDYDTHHRT